MSQGVMLSIRYDPFHRAVNDIKLACKHSCGGLFRRVMLFSAYIFGINYGPFGKGSYFHEKKYILEHFLSLCDSTSPEFKAFSEHYARDNDMRHETDDDIEKVWDSLLDMPSVNSKGPLTKLMRWFSWWENYNFHRGELHALKAIIGFYFELERGDDAAASIDIPSGQDMWACRGVFLLLFFKQNPISLLQLNGCQRKRERNPHRSSSWIELLALIAAACFFLRPQLKFRNGMVEMNE